MKYNKMSGFERPPEKCPRTCGECKHFNKERGTCRPNGIVNMTFAFSRPTDRPLPMPLSCPWWYMNRVWHEVDDKAIAEYRETRLHEITAGILLANLEGSELRAFLEHFFRPGGGRLIDFKLYSEAEEIYKEVVREDGYKKR